MDLINLRPNLPGVRTSTSFDWVKPVSTSNASTGSILLIGTARDGTSDPWRLPAVSAGLRMYGPMTDALDTIERRNHLTRGILEASEAGCNDIWCMRIGGTKASLNPTYTGAYLELEALYAGVKYGDLYGTTGIGVMITEDTIIIKAVDGQVYSYKFTDGVTTYSDLIDAINGTSLNTKVRAGMRGNLNADEVITSAKPAIIICENAEMYDVDPTYVLQFKSIDGDDNSGGGWEITFPGTTGSCSNDTPIYNKFCILRGVNDVISIWSSTMPAGIYENISVLDPGINLAFFTGAELAAQLEDKLNANSLLTNSGINLLNVVFTQGLGFQIIMGSAYSGYSGVSGESGYSEYSGFSGYSGASGVSGYSGLSGYEGDVFLMMDVSSSTIAGTIGFVSDPLPNIVLTSTVLVDFNVITNGNDRFVLSENGQYMRMISVSPGYYVAATLVNAINAAILAAGGSTVCSHNAGVFTFTSSRCGSGSYVALALGSTSFLPTIGYDGSVTILNGTGFARFLDVATAQEIADRITSSTVKLSALPYRNATGNVVKIYSRVCNNDGSIETESDINSTMNPVLGIPEDEVFVGRDGNLQVLLPGAMSSTWGWVYFSGGDDGMDMTNDELLDALAAAYAQIEDLAGPDYIVALGAYAFVDEFGTVDWRHAMNLARCCTIRSSLGHYTHGVMAVEPIQNNNLESVNARVAQIAQWNFTMNYTDDYFSTTTTPVVAPQTVNGVQQNLNMRNMLSILAGPEFNLVQSDIGFYRMTGEAVYAGANTALRLQSACTNKILAGPTGLYYEYGLAALDALTGARFVTFKRDNAQRIRCVSDVTYDYKGQTYDDLYTFRLMSYAVKNEIEIALPYIGEAASPQNISSLGSAIQKFLDGMKSSGLLQDFSYTLSNPKSSFRMADLYIVQTLNPTGQIKRIFIATKLSNRAAA